jgi:hypothetical protein
MPIRYPLKIKAQPTESSCGSTCLQAVYTYYHDPVEIEDIMAGITELKTGGVLGANLGVHALERGYHAIIYTHNLRVFDPTWFRLSREQLLSKLEQQMAAGKNEKVTLASELYHEFISKGGEVRLETLSPLFLRDLLARHGPLITGLSATYLYRSKREYGPACDYDDVRGEPQGHFVVISGISQNGQTALIADPHEHNPVAEGQNYSVSTIELINSILIGVITYDANIILIQPKEVPSAP